MTRFGCPIRNAQDIKVLFIGLICTMLIFSVVTIGEGVLAAPVTHIDLVHDR